MFNEIVVLGHHFRTDTSTECTGSVDGSERVMMRRVVHQHHQQHSTDV